MFHAAPAFLPSSVALTLTMLSTSLHIDGEYIEAIFFGMLSVVGLGKAKTENWWGWGVKEMDAMNVNVWVFSFFRVLATLP